MTQAAAPGGMQRMTSWASHSLADEIEAVGLLDMAQIGKPGRCAAITRRTTLCLRKAVWAPCRPPGVSDWCRLHHDRWCWMCPHFDGEHVRRRLAGARAYAPDFAITKAVPRALRAGWIDPWKSRDVIEDSDLPSLTLRLGALLDTKAALRSEMPAGPYVPAGTSDPSRSAVHR